MQFEGVAHRFGNDIDTDVILPGPYMNLSRPEDLAAHALEGLDPGFVGRVRPGDVLVVGRNFGCGSSREHAPIALRASGIACIIAKSFARIFFRNAINVGLPLLIAPDAVEQIPEGARVRVDTGSGRIQAGAQVFTAQPFPPFVQQLIDDGGLDGFVRRRLAERRMR